jgi:hypothetical protein
MLYSTQDRCKDRRVRHLVYLVYALANKRCQNFKTCGDHGDLLEGTSKVNLGHLLLVEDRSADLLNSKCPEARKQKECIAKLMAAPPVQGSVHYVYRSDWSLKDVDEKIKPEGAVFACAHL